MAQMAVESREEVIKYYPPKIESSVMLVDRDLTELVRLRRLFQSCSYKVSTFNVESAALATLQEKKGEYDLVLADVHMPELDGYFFLRTVVEKHEVPVILMSADQDPEIARKAIDNGACFFQQKPLGIETIKSLWQHVLRVRIMNMKVAQLKVIHAKKANQNGENAIDLTQADKGGSENKTSEAAHEIQDKVEKNDLDNANDMLNLTWEQNMKLIDQLRETESYRRSLVQDQHRRSLMGGQTNSIIQKPPRLAPSPPDVGFSSRYAMLTPFDRHLFVPHQRGISSLIQSGKHSINSNEYSPRSSSTSNGMSTNSWKGTNLTEESHLLQSKLNMIGSLQTGRLNQSSTLLGRLSKPSVLGHNRNEVSYPMSSALSLSNFDNAATVSNSSNILPKKNSIGTGKQSANEKLQTSQMPITSDMVCYGILSSSSLQPNKNSDGPWGANTTLGNMSNGFKKSQKGFRIGDTPHALHLPYNSSSSNAQQMPYLYGGSSSPCLDMGAMSAEKSCLGNPTRVGFFQGNNQFQGDNYVPDNGQGMELETRRRSFPNYGAQSTIENTDREDGIAFAFNGESVTNSTFISPNLNNAGIDVCPGPSVGCISWGVENDGYPTTAIHPQQPCGGDQVDAFGGLTEQTMEKQNDCFDPNNTTGQNSMLCMKWLQNDSAIHVNGSANVQLLSKEEEELDMINQFLNDPEVNEESNSIPLLGNEGENRASLVGDGNTLGMMPNENRRDNMVTDIEDTNTFSASENMFTVDGLDGGWYSGISEEDYNVFFNGIEQPEQFTSGEHPTSTGDCWTDAQVGKHP